MGEAAPSSQRRVILRGFAFSVAFFAATRLLGTLAMYVTTVFSPGRKLHQSFLAWDVGWYFKLINNGYPRELVGQGDDAKSTVAFFPLFPMTVRAVKAITPLGTMAAGVLVAVTAGAVAVCLLWLLAYRLSSDAGLANRSIAIFCLFPASFVILLPYPEGLMLAFSIGCILCLLRERWVLAGVCAALATAARPNAIGLALCCAWAAGSAIWRKRDWKALAAPALAPTGILGYFLFLWHHTGSFTAWLHVQQEGWGYGSEPDRLVSLKSIQIFWQHPLTDLNSSMTAVALIMAGVGLLFLARWKPPAGLTILSVSICLIAFGFGGPASKMRYLMGAFPIAIAVAHWAKHEMRFALVLAASAVGFTLYAAVATNTLMTVL